MYTKYTIPIMKKTSKTQNKSSVNLHYFLVRIFSNEMLHYFPDVENDKYEVGLPPHPQHTFVTSWIALLPHFCPFLAPRKRIGNESRIDVHWADILQWHPFFMYFLSFSFLYHLYIFWPHFLFYSIYVLSFSVHLPLLYFLCRVGHVNLKVLPSVVV